MTAGHGEKRTRKQQQAIAALLTAPTMAEAAARCGISEKTLWRWSQHSEFAEAYRKAQQRLLESAINALRQAALTFAETLRIVAADASAPPASRATAARSGLEVLLKAVTIEDLERRVNELEKNAAIIQKRRQ
jgi:uncharacterized protein YcbX